MEIIINVIIALILIGVVLGKVFFYGAGLIEILWYLFNCLTFGKYLNDKDEQETYHSVGVGLYIMIFFIAFIVLVVKLHSTK